jgi:hypothetical protein
MINTAPKGLRERASHAVYTLTSDLFTDIFRSAFKLVYAHDDHVARVLFIFLNIWWLFLESLPQLDGQTIFSLGMFTYAATGVCIFGVVIGFLLILFRESKPLIQLNYATTFLLLLTGAASSLLQDNVGDDFGAFVILAALCALSYFKYTIRSFDSIPALAAKVRIDADMLRRHINTATQE